MAAGGEAEAPNLDRVVAEEYKRWKKNSAYLYELVMSQSLEWPSLTVQFLPYSQPAETGKPYSEQRFLIGTHTNGEEPDFLRICTIRMPNANTKVDQAGYNDDRGEAGAYGTFPTRLSVHCNIVHDGEVNRARACPHKDELIATKSRSGQVYIFNYFSHPFQPEDTNECKPDLRLTGHEQEGYALDWSPTKQGRLVSGADDHQVCFWDIGGTVSGGREVAPVRTYAEHSNVVEDVSCSHHTEHLFASVSDDRSIRLWDARQDKSASQVLAAHKAEINTIDFNPKVATLFATGSGDGTVAIWDTRNLRTAIHSVSDHDSEVFGVSWSPYSSTALASFATDRRVFVWDFSRIGEELPEAEQEDGPPELMFIHGGHTAKVNDVSWSELRPWTLASVAADNILQIWQPATTICERPSAAEKEAQAAGKPDKEIERDE